MTRTRLAAGIAVLITTGAMPLQAQTFPTGNPVLERIWDEGMNRSQLYPLAQTLLDSIGPRLTGTPGMQSANEWLVHQYGAWGITARNERYGTWTGWRDGAAHIDLLEPRVRSLEGALLPWSPGTQGPAQGPVTIIPALASAAEFEAWLPEVQGRWVMVSYNQPTCRPDDNWRTFARPDSFERMQAERTAGRNGWNDRLAATGVSPTDLPARLEQAGALGVLTNNWAGGWGTEKYHIRARTQSTPTVNLSCEDYGLVYRLAENEQSPVVRVNAGASMGTDVPTFNTVAEIRGRERPNEYVILSAHLDSWGSGSGATDNGTGTVTMMEVMRILKTVYPNPRRTILVGHWGGEEQGLNGSRAFSEDHPRIVRNIHALFNQDNGTGRIQRVNLEGLTAAGEHFSRWFSQLPSELTGEIRFSNPGFPSPGSSDHAAFICHGAPAFMLGSLGWDYGTYTWHTNRDTFDKLVFDDLRENAVLIASLAYLAAEDRTLMPRDRRAVMPAGRTGQTMTWPACTPATRDAAHSHR
jgi:carboxypeptidase Q